jgi:hypothetical protein
MTAKTLRQVSISMAPLAAFWFIWWIMKEAP